MSEAFRRVRRFVLTVGRTAEPGRRYPVSSGARSRTVNAIAPEGSAQSSNSWITEVTVSDAHGGAAGAEPPKISEQISS